MAGLSMRMGLTAGVACPPGAHSPPHSAAYSEQHSTAQHSTAQRCAVHPHLTASLACRLCCSSAGHSSPTWVLRSSL